MRTLLALVLFSCVGFAQPSQVQVNADCVIAFTITAVNQTGPSTGSYDNRQVGCQAWQMQYGSTGFSGVTLALQSSTDNVSFGTMSGSVTFGTNPLTSTTGASLLQASDGTNFAPFVRVQATTATGSGTIRGILLGYRAAGTAGAVGPGSNVTITAPLGQAAMSAGVSVTLPNNQLSGCTRALVNLSGSGNTQIVALSGSTKIYICDMEFSTGIPEDFKLTEGTGSNCASGTADVTALMKNISAWSLTPAGAFAAAAATATGGDALCANQANAQAAAVTIWYIQQ